MRTIKAKLQKVLKRHGKFVSRVDLLKSINREQLETIRELKAERKDKCTMCSEFENNRQWLVSTGNGMYLEYTYEYCPICGRKLDDVEGEHND